jgi:hypothetical protein
MDITVKTTIMHSDYVLALIRFKTITLNSLSPDLGAGLKKDDIKKIKLAFSITILLLHTTVDFDYIQYIVTYVRFPPLIYP